MLTVPDLVNIQYIPEISDISLSLIMEFYEQHLCKRFYLFELEDGQKIKLYFKDTSEVFHISGIDHIYDGIPMDGVHFAEGIKNNTITLETLERINSAAYKDYIDRIRSVVCIDTIIKNCEYLWFSEGSIEGTDIRVTYLLLKGLDDKNLHLGIDTYKKDRPYFARTLLVTEGATASKFTDKAEKRIRIKEIIIQDRDNNAILETVKRSEAIKKANEIIGIIANEWFQEELPVLISEYKENLPDTVPNSRKKREWAGKLIKHLEEHREDIRCHVKRYDPYWTSKIVAEQTRNYRKEAVTTIEEKIQLIFK